MKLIIGLAALLLVSACTTDAVTSEQDQLAASCQASGGTLKQVGRLQSWKCITPYADAGKSCTDSSQCAGDCQAPITTQPGAAPISGTCQADNNRFGCSSTVENGRLGRGLCID